MGKPVAFIDFQGTLGGQGIDDIRSFNFYPFSIEAIRELNREHILVIGITNQSHIAKGELTMEEYENKLQILKDELTIHKAYFDAVYCCPHDKKDNCDCKKPLPGMVEKAKEDFDIDMDKAYVIGDMGMADMVLGKNINAKGILVLTGVGKGSLNEFRHTWSEAMEAYVAENVLDGVHWLINDLKLMK